MALKSCPACKKQVGPRTKKCECGHVFSTEGVAASGQSMTLDPLDKWVAESVGAVKDIIAKVERTSGKLVNASHALPPVTVTFQKAESVPTDARRTTIANQQPLRHYGGGAITTPAGAPPCTPKGYKDGWPDGPASDEVVTEWAYNVMDTGGGKYAPEAVVYWARYFWDINGPEFRRVRELIVKALRPPQATHDPADY